MQMSIFISSRSRTVHILVILNLLCGINFHYLPTSASSSFNCFVLEMKAQLVLGEKKGEKKYKLDTLENKCLQRTVPAIL